MTFERLTKEEVERVLSLLPPAVLKQLQRENVVLAGGCIRDVLAGIPVKDLDVFCHSEKQAEHLAMAVSPFARHTTFAYSVVVAPCPLPIQFIYYKDFSNAEDLISQMDFRACCAGIYWDGNEFVGVAVDGMRFDCQARELHFMSQKKDEGKLTALRRALDFSRKGWTISNEELADIIVHYEDTVAPLALPSSRTERRASVVKSFRPAYGRV